MKITHAYVQNGREVTPLNALRIEKGLTFRAISEAVGAPLSVVYYWFNNKVRPADNYINKLAEVFEVDAEIIRKHTVVNKPEVVKPEAAEPVVKESSEDYKKAPRKRLNTYWNNKRIEANLTIREVAECLGNKVKVSNLGKYFAGKAMPDDETVRLICTLFDVDYKEGKKEFAKANKACKRKKSKKVFHQVSHESEAPVEVVEPVEQAVEASVEKPMVEEPVAEKSEPAWRKVGNAIYGCIPYSEFLHVMDAIGNAEAKDSIAETLYGQVDFDTFNKVMEVIEKSSELPNPEF
jgi:transcriptional regulator with XRE-family HTH domain